MALARGVGRSITKYSRGDDSANLHSGITSLGGDGFRDSTPTETGTDALCLVIPRSQDCIQVAKRTILHHPKSKRTATSAPTTPNVFLLRCCASSSSANMMTMPKSTTINANTPNTVIGAGQSTRRPTAGAESDWRRNAQPKSYLGLGSAAESC